MPTGLRAYRAPLIHDALASGATPDHLITTHPPRACWSSQTLGGGGGGRGLSLNEEQLSSPEGTPSPSPNSFVPENYSYSAKPDFPKSLC